MTATERRQPSSTFVNAGKGAFLIGVHIQNNPYREQPFRDLWDKGYRSARRKYDRNRKSELMLGGEVIR